MLTFQEQESGPLRIFRLPELGMVYTIGIDASSGLAEDYSVIQVLSNTIPYEQVAIYRSKSPVNEVSDVADKLGRFYNEAMIVCEINYPGNSIQDALLQFYRYPRNYQPETHLDEDVDVSCKYGFRTTESSKWLLINETQLAFRNDELIINDPVTSDEFLNFVYQSSSRKAAAAAGMNDDTVMSFMLAYHGAKLYPFVRPRVEKKTNMPKVDTETHKIWENFRNRMMQPSRKGKIL